MKEPEAIIYDGVHYTAARCPYPDCHGLVYPPKNLRAHIERHKENQRLLEHEARGLRAFMNQMRSNF